MKTQQLSHQDKFPWELTIVRILNLHMISTCNKKYFKKDNS